MEHGQQSTPQPPAESGAAPSQPESAAVPVETQPATPAPAPGETTETLKAEVERLQGEVHQRDVTIGRQGAELGDYRAQTPQPAGPAETQPAVGAHPLAAVAEAIQYGDAAQVAAAAQQLDAYNRQVAEEVAAPLVQAGAHQVQTRMKFYADNPHLVGKEHLVGSVHTSMQEKGEFAGMNEAQGLAEVAKRATSEMAPNVSQTPAPTPPPTAPATAPSQAPPSPAGATQQPVDHEAEAAKTRSDLLERQQQQRTGQGPPAVG